MGRVHSMNLILSETNGVILVLIWSHQMDENQWESWSADFIRSQLIRIYAVFKEYLEFWKSYEYNALNRYNIIPII